MLSFYKEARVSQLFLTKLALDDAPDVLKFSTAAEQQQIRSVKDNSDDNCHEYQGEPAQIDQQQVAYLLANEEDDHEAGEVFKRINKIAPGTALETDPIDDYRTDNVCDVAGNNCTDIYAEKSDGSLNKGN